MGTKLVRKQFANPIIDGEFSEVRESLKPQKKGQLVPARQTRGAEKEGPVVDRVLRG